MPWLKTQSPSQRRWRLRLELSHACRFDLMINLGHAVRTHGQSPLPELLPPSPYLDARPAAAHARQDKEKVDPRSGSGDCP